MPAILCALLAFLLHCHAIQSKRPLVLFLFSGVSLGMAIGIRLSFAPVIVPFLFAIAVHRPAATKDRVLRVVAFTIGGLLANLPAIYFCLTNYQQFVFGNLGYRQLQPKFPTPMTFVEKIQYLKPVFAPPGDLLILLLAFYSLAVCGIELKRRSAQPRLETQFLLLLLVFILLGCIAPTPTFYQYHFALVPFLLLLMVYALSELRSMFAEVASLLLIVGSLFSTVYVFPLKNAAKHRRFLAPDSWTPMRVHAEAQWIRSHVDPEARAKVLTLSPLYAIESGLSIYNEFVTGPFAWRVSDLLPEKQAAQRGLPLLLEAARLFDEKRPHTVLTGKEGKELEIPLTREAERRGYKPVATPTGSVIWKSPE